MSSMRCPQCGLINWATAEACKRCKLSFVEGDAPEEIILESESGADAPGARSAQDSGANAPPPQAPPEWTPTVPPREWRSPYDRTQRAEECDRSIDIDFEVAPFVDTATTIRDTYALARSQFKLILKIVCAAVAPHMLLLLAVGASAPAAASRTLPSVESYFGASPRVPPSVAGPEFTGIVGLFLALIVAYQFLRWAVMPSALIYGLVTTLRTGETPGIVECYGWGFRRSFSAGLAMLASGAAILLGLIFFIVPGVILAICFSLIVPVIAIEGSRTVEALRRSYDLTRGRRGTIFCSSLAWGALIFLVTIAMTVGLGIVSAVLRSEMIFSVASLVLTEVMSATGIVLSLVIYLGIAHYGKFTPVYSEGVWTHVEGGWTHAGSSDNRDARAAGGWNPPPAHGSPHGYAAAQQQQQGSSKGLIIALVAAGAFAMLVFVGVIAAIAVPNLLASRRAANEASAIKSLRTVFAAQASFQTLEDRYASLQELTDRDLLGPDFAGGVIHGYRIQVTATGDSFEATATPVSYPSTGKRSFYISTDGVIRGADRSGRPADAEDTPIGSRDAYAPRNPTREDPTRGDSPFIVNPEGLTSSPAGS